MRHTTLAVMVLVTASLAWTEVTPKQIEKRLRSAAEILHDIMEAPDKGIPLEVIEHAKCIAVIPHEIRGGLVVGAMHGRGVATCRTPNGEWSAPAFFTITGGSWGAQIGLEGVDNILVFMNQRGVDRLLQNKFTIGGELSAAAGPVGRHASAGTDWKLDSEILTYSRSKGLFAGATLDGAVVRPDTEAMAALYGPDVSTRAVLTGEVKPPEAAKVFLAAVRGAELEARKAS